MTLGYAPGAQQLYAIFAQDLVSLHNCTADIATLQFMDLASRYVAIRPTHVPLVAESYDMACMP